MGQVTEHEAKTKENRNFQCQVSAQSSMSNRCSREMTAHVKLTAAAFYVKNKRLKSGGQNLNTTHSEERVKHLRSYSYDLVYINIV